MAFNGSFKVKEPEKVEATMTITMTVEEWAAVRKQLNSSHPGWRFSGLITDLVNQVERVYWPATPKDSE